MYDREREGDRESVFERLCVIERETLCEIERERERKREKEKEKYNERD